MVTSIMAAVVGVTFLFGFGNVLSLALRLGAPGWVAPLITPAVDLSILSLPLAIRQLVANGAAPQEIRPARRLLIFASLVTLALNIADPLVRGQWGKAAFDAVGPLLRARAANSNKSRKGRLVLRPPGAAKPYTIHR